jgi:hypothetical protein
MTRAAARGDELPLATRVITALGGALITGLMRTTRYDVLTPEIYERWLRPGRRDGGAAVFLLWHGRLLPC